MQSMCFVESGKILLTADAILGSPSVTKTEGGMRKALRNCSNAQTKESSVSCMSRLAARMMVSPFRPTVVKHPSFMP